MKYTFTWMVVLLLGSSPLFAQDTVQLSLGRAVSLTLLNNKQLKADSARVDQASSRLRQARDARLPDVKVSGSYLQLNHPNVNLKTKGGTDPGSGTEIAKPSSAVYGMATVSLPLYTASRIRYGIEAAGFLEEAVKLDGARDRGLVVLNTVNAYTNLYKAYAAVNVVKENLNQSQQRDRDFSNLEKNGLLARNDLLKAQLQTSDMELELVNAENNVTLCTVGLNLMLGLPERTKLQIDTASIRIEADLQPVETYEQLALTNRNDIKAAARRHDAAGISIKQARSEYFPSVGLTGGYIAADVPGLLTVTNAVNAGVGVQYNLGSLWKTKSKMQEAKAVERELNANAQQLEENIRMEVTEAYQNYLSEKKRIEVRIKALENARENNRITKNKFDNNLVNTTELLDAGNALLAAAINLETAKADLFSAYHTLLQRAGIDTTANTK